MQSVSVQLTLDGITQLLEVASAAIRSGSSIACCYSSIVISQCSVDSGRDWLQDRVDDTVGDLLHQEFTTGGNGRVTVRQHGEFRVRCAVCGVLT